MEEASILDANLITFMAQCAENLRKHLDCRLEDINLSQFDLKRDFAGTHFSDEEDCGFGYFVDALKETALRMTQSGDFRCNSPDSNQEIQVLRSGHSVVKAPTFLKTIVGLYKKTE